MNNSGWKFFTPSRHKVSKYEGRIVVIVSARGKTKMMYFNEMTIERLGKPKRVVLATRGSNVAIMPTTVEGDGYALQRPDKGGTPFCACSAFVKEFNLQDGVYDAHVETNGGGGNMIVFDMQDTPSRR